MSRTLTIAAPKRVGHLTGWDTLVAPGVLQQKDGSFLACLRVRWNDLSSTLPPVEIAQASRLNSLLRRLGHGWGLMSETMRPPVTSYPAQTFPDVVSQCLDTERKGWAQTPGHRYGMRATLTLTYRRPPLVFPWWKSLLFTHLPQRDLDAETQAWFTQEIDRFLGLLRGVCADAEWLVEGDLLRYLKSTISVREHAVVVPDIPTYLDTYLSDTDLTLEHRWPSVLRWPRLGEQWVRCVGVKSYPQETHPGLLDALADLPLPYRCVCRYIPLGHDEAVKKLQKVQNAHRGMKQGLLALALEQLRATAPALDDQAAQAFEEETAAQQAGIRRGAFSYGYLTQTVVVMDETFDGATAKAEQVAEVINQADFVAKVETLNTLDAWVGTLPGQMTANVRQPLLHSHNLAHLLPLSMPWAGPDWNTHLQGPPLLQAVGPGGHPFALDTYDGDVGMAYVAGPIGAGKSTLLATMVHQWLKHPRAQVRIFDTGQSLRCMTHALGGQWYDVAAMIEGVGKEAQHLDDATAQFWGSPWVPGEHRWQCFELEGILRTPALIETVIAPLMQVLKDRMTGDPTMFVFDEGHLYLLHAAFAKGIDDYLRGLRKKNGCVVFATQSIADAARSDLAPIISDSAMTRLYLPNYHALESETAKIYQGWGLNKRQCEILARLVPKQDYYYQGRQGHRVFQLALGPMALAFAGASTKPDLAMMGRLYQGKSVSFAIEWLHAKGLHTQADYLKSEVQDAE